MSGAPRRSLAPGVVLAGLLAIFALSVAAREERFGTLEGRGHEWLTGSAVKFTRNWHREGAWALRFAMLENPRSIEFSTLRDREPYVSYPVGCLLPIYAVSTITRREPSPAMVMSVNLAGQLVGALAVFALVLVALESLELGFALRATLGALAFMLYVFLPGPFYWLQNVYFSDQAILPFVVIAILLEVVNDQAPRPGWMRLQSWVVGLGVFTDWFMVPVAAMLLVKKLPPQLVNLPIEFDASRRAAPHLIAMGVITPDEQRAVRRVMQAAACASLAGTLTSFPTAYHYLVRPRRRARDQRVA